MSKENIIGVSSILACAVAIWFVSHEMFFDKNLGIQESTSLSESSTTEISNIGLESNNVTINEVASPVIVPKISQEKKPSSTTATESEPTLALEQTELQKEVLVFWQTKYSRMKNLKSASDFVLYMSDEDPNLAEMFKFTTEEEEKILYADFQKMLYKIISVIEEKNTNLDIIQLDSSQNNKIVVSLVYKNLNNVINLYIQVNDLASDVEFYLGTIELNGQILTIDEELWNQIATKSDERYFESLE